MLTNTVLISETKAIIENICAILLLNKNFATSVIGEYELDVLL